MNILVVGGAGYIGSHMCLQLAAAGYSPITLDDLSTGHREAVQWGELIVAPLDDAATVAEIIRCHSIHTVMHFAACSLVGESMQDPFRYYRNNLASTLQLLIAARDAGVKHFVFSSTAAVYGEPQSEQIDEDHPCRPVNPYGRSKLAVEMLLQDASRAYGLHVANLRYFNAAGAAPDSCIGESHAPETHLIARLLKRAAGENLDVRIFGADYPTRDGSCVRDYIHVCDLALAHLKAMEYIRERPGFHCFNLGSGTGHTVLEIIDAAEKVLGRCLDIPIAPRRPGDPAVLVAHAKKAADVLKWQPCHSAIDKIIMDAWAWHRNPAF